MNMFDEARLRASLTAAIEQWIEHDTQGTNMPVVGENIAGSMAVAAIAVLVGVADLYEYLQRSGELKDDE